MTLDEAVQEFAEYVRGRSSFDELDFKEYLIDVWRKEQVVSELEELLGQQDHEGHPVEPTSNSVRDRINKLKENYEREN